ncbi:type II toxin-antitoxin system RelE/ParE family toxin (plasmid) [Lactobacillus sp. PV037]|uniref:type II toxin-antitoxin system RelE/ParE family toxin n=1 Tax=Lactobacillus sp. PV037 TaxID=2594496 RepID=UPI0022409F6C|nr:type II toxin-antitoxin system RelE/ParE family toxin [Lactobacillus sp. PV037]QNQ82932.1 type II toxin-antitoxin system RelE/ParE family toxin [Lactobacillus sp. PV037]
MYNIDFYEDKNGQSDIIDFIKKLDRSNQKQDKQILTKLYYQLDMLSNLGNRMKMPQSKFLKGYKHPLMELRPQPERVFYASWKKDRYVILSHYTKKDNKTDPKEIAKALARLDDWLERNN